MKHLQELEIRYILATVMTMGGKVTEQESVMSPGNWKTSTGGKRKEGGWECVQGQVIKGLYFTQ